MQTILSRNLPSETYEILKNMEDDNSYLKLYGVIMMTNEIKTKKEKNIFMESN